MRKKNESTKFSALYGLLDNPILVEFQILLKL